jgi:hypothetical protein
MNIGKKLSIHACAAAIAVSALPASVPTQASDAGAFIGGMLTSTVVRNMKEQSQAEQAQAYYSQQAAQRQVPQAAPAAASTSSPQQKLDELDKLAAGGYISPEEYKTKKKAILDAM